MTDPTPAAARVATRLDVVQALAKTFTPHALIAIGVLAYFLRLPDVAAGGLVTGGFALLKGQG